MKGKEKETTTADFDLDFSFRSVGWRMEMEVEEGGGDVPQSKPLDGDQVLNNAGGYGWAVDDMTRLRRFLCLGSEGGSYYVGEQKLGLENAGAILRLVASGKGELAVQEIVQISVAGRAAKQDPTIFALALCARSDDPATKKAAYEALNKVCRIPTHLFSFVEFCENLSGGTGWGRAHRRAICNWYNSNHHRHLAMAVTKYQSRNGWSHLDVLRLCHIKPANVGVACVCKYVVKGFEACREVGVQEGDEKLMRTVSFLEAVEAAKTADEATVVKLIREKGLVREHVPTTHLNSVEVRVH